MYLSPPKSKNNSATGQTLLLTRLPAYPRIASRLNLKSHLFSENTRSLSALQLSNPEGDRSRVLEKAPIKLWGETMPKRRVQSAPSQPESGTAPESVLAQLEALQAQLRDYRQALMHSHRLATLGTITSIVAHEYHNILTPLISYAQMALAQPEDRTLTLKALEKALTCAERAVNISTSLLGFAREADQEQVARLPKVVQEALTCLARDPRKDGIELTVDVPDVLVAIPPIHLEQVLVNLLLNARQVLAGQRGGCIAIRATVQGQEVHLEVQDSGPGIPPEIRERLFEPFVTCRTPGSSGERKGTGLGLAICRELITGAGGTISCTSEPGQGTCFHITLPRAAELLPPG